MSSLTGRGSATPRPRSATSGTGAFLCPEAGLATVVLTGRDFGPWALEARPSFSDAELERYAPFRQADP